MFKNRSNYNINGYYEGQNLSKFKNVIDFLKDGRGGRIWACDPLVPNQMRYQALRPRYAYN